MTKRLALLLAAALAACQPALQGTTPSPVTTVPVVRDDGLTVHVKFTGRGAGSQYQVAFALTEVSKLVVGLFDRATDASTVPSLGYFNDNGAGNSSVNPLTAAEFTSLQGALGTSVGTGTADETNDRRYLFRTINSPATTTPAAVTLTNFPTVSATAPVHLYNLFVCALDSYGNVIGYTETDLSTSVLTAGSISLTASLDYGGLGTLEAGSTINASEFDPLAGLDGLVVGTFDTGSTPHFGWIHDGTSNVAFAGTEDWYPALKDFLTAKGMTDAANTRRYLIRKYAPPVSGGSLVTTSANVPVGNTYRTFVMAFRNQGTDAGHLLSGSGATVNAGATTTVSLGAFVTGWIRTAAGDGTNSYLEGPALSARMSDPHGVFVDGEFSIVYFADSGNHKIRAINTSGSTELVAGGAQGYRDSANGTPQFDTPRAVVKDSLGNLFVADSGNNRIRRIDGATGEVTTHAGGSTAGNMEGTGTQALLSAPTGLAIDSSDNLYVADKGAHNIKKISPAGQVTIVAGDSADPGRADYVESTGTQARFNSPSGVALSADETILYVADTGNHRVRRISLSTGTTSLVAGNGVGNYLDDNGSLADINSPWGIVCAPDGVLYVSDGLQRLRKIHTNADVRTIAGTGTTAFRDGDLGTSMLNNPRGLALDTKGNLYVADSGNHRIRKVQ